MTDPESQYIGHSVNSWICAALIRIGTRMATHFDQHFAAFDITQAQFKVLIAVNAADPNGIAPALLAKQLLVERATVSVMTNRLVERGLLVRRSTTANRRTFNLVLTDAGLALLYQITPIARKLAFDTFQGFAAADVAQLGTLLEVIEQRLTDADPRTAPH